MEGVLLQLYDEDSLSGEARLTPISGEDVRTEQGERGTWACRVQGGERNQGVRLRRWR